MSHLRNHPRVASQREVLLGQGGHAILGEARDLSMAGCFVVARDAPSAGPVEVVFREGGESVRCRGQIVRRVAQGVAVRFDALDWGDIFGLARLISPALT
ncbi:MAG: PilZ domain-containing protein [Deltaproteobacteria bacterium]